MSTFKGQPLFHQSTIVKEAYARLSHDRNQWETEILDLLHEQYPYLADHPIRVVIKKADADEGHGVGSININESVRIPIIVNASRIQPFDLFMDKEGDIHAFSRSSLEAALQPTTLGKPKNPATSGASADGSLTHRVMPPYDGKYAYAGLEDVVEVSEAEMGDMLKQADPVTLSRLSKSAKFRKLAKRYMLPTEHLDTPSVEARLLDKMASLSKLSGYGQLETADGSVQGYMANKVFSLSGSNLENYGMFISKEAEILFTAETVLGTECDQVKIASTTPNLRDTAILMWPQNGELVVSEPFTLTGAASDHIKVASLGRETKLVFSEGTEEIVATANTTYVPAEAQIMKVAGEVPRSNASVDLAKHANATVATVLDANTIRVTGNCAALGFSQEDAWMGVPTRDVMSKVAELMPDQVRQFAEHLNEYGVGALEVVEKEAEQYAGTVSISDEARTNILRGLAEVYALSDDQLNKIAEESKSDPKSVDAVLGLNFLNRERQAKFVDGLPVLEDAMKIFAKLLIASRLGLGIEPEPIRSALFSVDAVIRDLRELRNA